MFHSSIMGHEYVLQLDISMYQVVLVNPRQRHQQRHGYFVHRTLLGKGPALLKELLQQVPSRAVLHDQVDVVIILEGGVELHHVGNPVRNFRHEHMSDHTSEPHMAAHYHAAKGRYHKC